MKVSEIPLQSKQLTPIDIKNGYMLGMKNIYPDDDVPVYELQRFPISAYISDIDIDSTKQLIQRMRNISVDVIEQKDKLKKLVDNVKTVTLTDVSAANLQKLEGTVSYDEVTSQLTEKYASPEELQTTINIVYKELFSAIEEMMVQVFTTSMYARQYTPIFDDISG